MDKIMMNDSLFVEPIEASFFFLIFTLSYFFQV